MDLQKTAWPRRRDGGLHELLIIAAKHHIWTPTIAVNKKITITPILYFVVRELR